jgi:hypothetical protein
MGKKFKFSISLSSRKRKIIAYVLAITTFTAVFFQFSPLSSAQAKTNPDHKIDICHATSSHTNPYTTNNVDKNSTVQGHDLHNGPIWYEGITGNWGDIIPPYAYYELEIVGSHEECPNSASSYDFVWLPGKTCIREVNFQGFKFYKYAYPNTVDDYGWVEYQYPGKNWTTQGQAIWNNGCEIPYEQCSVTEESIGQWSDWTVDPNDPSQEFKVRVISQLDSEDNSIVCSSEEEREYRDVVCYSTIRSFGEWSDWMQDPNDHTQEYRERWVYIVDSKDGETECADPVLQKQYQYIPCSSTYRVFGEWSDWMIDPSDDTQEYRTREAKAVDSKDSELVCAGPITQTETRDIEQEYEMCTLTNTVYGEWSEWTLDPEDDTQEFRTRTVIVYDAEDSEFVCNEDVEIEYRDIEEEGEVLGTTDEKDTGEVLGTSVVPADTAGGSINPMIALIEFSLVILTGISFIYLGKKELHI